MSGKIRSAGLVTLMGVVVAALLLSAPGWAQKGRPPVPPPPPADPAIVVLLWGTRASGSDLMVMNADASNQRVLVPGVVNNARVDNRTPRWSPDGSRIAFYSDIYGGGVYVIDKNGQGLCKLAVMYFDLDGLDWTADGQNIIYATGTAPGQNEDYYLVSATPNPGSPDILTPPVQLTHTAGSEFSPACSPDGLHIAARCWVEVEGLPDHVPQVVLYDLVRDEYGNIVEAVYEKNLIGAGTLSETWGGNPHWANYSYRLALEAQLPTEVNPDLWIIDIFAPDFPLNVSQTLNEREFTPCWSPLDDKILFQKNGSLWLVNPDGSNLRLLAAPPRKSQYFLDPDWRHNP